MLSSKTSVMANLSKVHFLLAMHIKNVFSNFCIVIVHVCVATLLNEELLAVDIAICASEF